MCNQVTYGKVRRVAILLLMTLAFALQSQQAMADTPRVDDPAYYTIDSYGSGSLRIKMPVYNKSGTDRWVNKATLEVQEVKADGTLAAKEMVLGVQIVKDDDISGGAEDVEYNFYTNVNGLVELVSESEHVALSQTPKKVKIHFNDNSICFAEFDWFVPVKYRGRKVRFTWNIDRNTTNNDRYHFSFQKTMDIPEKSDLMDPILTSAIISSDTKYKGEILVPWMISVNDTLIESAKYGYTDAEGRRHEVDMDATASGYVRLDATGVYDSLYVIVDYWSWDEQKKSKSLAEKRMSDYYDVPNIHAPLGLKATPQYGRYLD